MSVGNRFDDIADWREHVAARMERGLQVLPDITRAQAEGLCDMIVSNALVTAGRGLGGMTVGFDLAIAPSAAWWLAVGLLGERGFSIREDHHVTDDTTGAVIGIQLFWSEDDDR